MYIKEYFTNYNLKDIFPEAYPVNQIYNVIEDDTIPKENYKSETIYNSMFDKDKFDISYQDQVNLNTLKNVSINENLSKPSISAEKRTESFQIAPQDSESVEIYGNKIKPLTEIDYSLVSKDNKKESILDKIDSKKLFFGAAILYILMR